MKRNKQDNDLYYCKNCDSYLELKDFYKTKLKNRSLNCKKCIQKIDRENYVYVKDTPCGSSRVPNKPNKFADEAQKKCTHEFLLLMGWKYNEINGIWWKEGFKNEDGKFVNINSNIHRRNKRITPAVRNEIIRLLKEGYRNKEIKVITGVSLPSITQIKQDEGLSNRRNRNTE